jgi:hypothetical protein
MNLRWNTMNCKLLSALLAGLAATLTSDLRAQAQPEHPIEQVPHKEMPVKVAPVGELKQVPISPQAPGVPVLDPQRGNTWFPSVELDLGTHFNHDTAVGKFTFKNPTGQKVDWKSIVGSCQCTSATITVGDRLYRYSKKPEGAILRVTKQGNKEVEERVSQIEVGADEGGEIEVHMEMGGQAGAKQATMDIHTTDPQLPMIRLKWQAIGAQVFVISPADVNLNQMVWNEKRDFTVTVQSPIQRDFEITRHDDAGKEFTVAYTKELNEGTATWTIAGTYSPQSADAVGGGQLKFYTDVQGGQSFTVRVSAAIQGPLEVKPGTFLALGMIRRGKVHTERIVFEPNDGTDLDAVDMRLEKLTIDPKYVVVRKSKDGKKLVVEFDVVADAPTGLLRGDLVVDLNHPAIKSKTILFNGFVR